jgi:hypothetical protein
MLAFLVGWLVFLGLNAPYRPRQERKPKAENVETVSGVEAELGEPEHRESEGDSGSEVEEAEE